MNELWEPWIYMLALLGAYVVLLLVWYCFSPIGKIIYFKSFNRKRVEQKLNPITLKDFMKGYRIPLEYNGILVNACQKRGFLMNEVEKIEYLQEKKDFLIHSK